MTRHEQPPTSRSPSYVAATLPFDYLLARALSFIRSHPGAEAADAMAYLLCAIEDPTFHPLWIGQLRRLDAEERGLAMGLLDACIRGSAGGLDRILLARAVDESVRESASAGNHRRGEAAMAWTRAGG